MTYIGGELGCKRARPGKKDGICSRRFLVTRAGGSKFQHTYHYFCLVTYPSLAIATGPMRMIYLSYVCRNLSLEML